MNILMIAHRLPYPPNKGEKIRSYHELAYLAERHDVWCASLVDDPADMNHVNAIRKLCRDVAAIPLNRLGATARTAVALLTGRSLSEAYFAAPKLRTVVKGWARQTHFDAVFTFSSNVARVGLCFDAPRRVADFCDADSAKWLALADKVPWPKSMIFRLEARRLARTEWQLTQDYDAVTLIAQRETDALERMWNRLGLPADQGVCRLSVIPNGIALPAEPQATKVGPGNVVGFTGTMSYLPNVEAVCWFAETVWPTVRRQHPDAEFLIVGRQPAPAVQALDGHKGIRVTGEVPDVSEYLKRFDLAVAPMRTVHGVQNKTLEALAAGIPVVATQAVAESIGAKSGKHLLAADEPDEFTAHICELINSSSRREALAHAGRAFVSDRFDWQQHLAELEKLLRPSAE